MCQTDQAFLPTIKAGDSALAGVPATYLIPGLVWNTHDSHTFRPAVTDTGLVSDMVCHPAEPLIVVAGVTPNLAAGDPLASA